VEISKHPSVSTERPIQKYLLLATAGVVNRLLSGQLPKEGKLLASSTPSSLDCRRFYPAREASSFHRKPHKHANPSSSSSIFLIFPRLFAVVKKERKGFFNDVTCVGYCHFRRKLVAGISIHI
jgi:hypothetical protein